MLVVAALTFSQTVYAQSKHYPLETVSGLRLHNVVAEPATLRGSKGLRVSIDPETARRAQTMTPEQQAQLEQLVIIEGTDFSDGIIEAEIAGALAPGAGAAARGFVGLAFRVQGDLRTYDAFYLRPLNARVDDQERRNHTTQYISHPDFPWYTLREQNPSKYESYVDLAPGEWTKVRIEVRGDKARLYVRGQEHAALIVNDVKTGAGKRGAIALWIGAGTLAHFRNLTVAPIKP
jgi:hypothetical protein